MNAREYVAKPHINGQRRGGRNWIWTAPALFLLLAAPLAAEYCYCRVGTTGLVKGDFTLTYTEFDEDGTAATEATTAVTVTEYPASSGYYQFDGLTDSTSGYHYSFTAEYPSGTVVCDYFYPWGAAPDDVAWTSPITINVNARTWKQSDTKPSLSLTVSDMTQDPTGWTCTFSLINQITKVVKVDDQSCTIGTVSGSGEYSFALQYDWAATDLNMSDCSGVETCAYYGEFKVTDGTGAYIYTFPANSSLLLTVTRRR